MSGRLPSILALTFLLSFAVIAQAQNPAVFNHGPNSGPLHFPFVFLSADFNNDGFADVVTLQSTSTGNSLLVFLNNGDGTYRGPFTVQAGTNLASVVVGDFDQDGNLDLAVINSTSGGSNNGSVIVVFGDGQGNFGTPTAYEVTGQPTGITVGDFNNDGRPDIAVSTGHTKAITILTNTGTGFTASSFTVPTFFDASNPTLQPDSIYTIVAGDFNADGKMDLVYGDACADSGCEVSQERYYLLTNTGSGFTPTLIAQRSTGAGTLHSGDLDGDGRSDLYFAYNGCHTPCSGITALYSNGDGTFSAVQIANGDSVIGGDPSDVIAGDFNNDGITDIAASVGSTFNVNPGLDIYKGKGGRAWFPKPDHFDSPNGLSASPFRIAAGFVDSDGSEDLLVAESDNFVPFYNNSSQAGNPCTFPSSPGLHLCLPSGNSASPVHFIGNYHAEAQPANRIELWLDGQKKFQVFSNRLDTSLPVANGTHEVTLVGVDSAGRLIKSSQDFTVGSSGGPCTPPATAGVVICAPAGGSTVDNPVSIIGAATATPGRQITAMRVYIDSQQRTTVAGDAIAEQDTIAPGSHNLTIVAWDETGQSYVQAESFTVSGTQPCLPSSAGVKICSPASGANVSSPVQFSAGAVPSIGRITAVRVYVDDQPAFTGTNNTSSTSYSINASINIGAGSHHVVVVGYESNGGALTAGETITVQ